MKRIERESWQPVSIETDVYKLDLHEVHGLTEVGFILWRKRNDGQLDLISSGHTFQGELVSAEEKPLRMTSGTHDTIADLLGR